MKWSKVVGAIVLAGFVSCTSWAERANGNGALALSESRTTQSAGTKKPEVWFIGRAVVDFS